MTKLQIRDQLKEIKYNLIRLNNNKLSAAEQSLLDQAYDLINTVVISLDGKIKYGE